MKYSLNDVVDLIESLGLHSSNMFDGIYKSESEIENDNLIKQLEQMLLESISATVRDEV